MARDARRPRARYRHRVPPQDGTEVERETGPAAEARPQRQTVHAIKSPGAEAAPALTKMTNTYLDERTYQTGDVIFVEGDTSTEMFIVQEGKVAVTKVMAGREVFLSTLERGDFFGEMALLDQQPRSATCYALAPTRLIAIKSGELLLKLRRDPTFALEMLQAMSRRIRLFDQQVQKLLADQMMSRQELAKALAKSEFGIREPGR